jgi:hypothetical protein
LATEAPPTRKSTDDLPEADHARIVVSGPTLNIADLIGKAKTLAVRLRTTSLRTGPCQGPLALTAPHFAPTTDFMIAGDAEIFEM